MSNLLSTTDGTNAMMIAQRFLLERRLSRFFKRNLVISYNEWLKGNGFHLETLLGELNKVHDDEVINLYRLLGLVGGLSETISDMNIYIDSVAGSDETGDGSAGAPYASMWFFNSLPKRINHEVNILFTSNYVVENYQPLIVDFEFGHDGYLNFVGVGAPEVVEGPFTVSTTGDVASGASIYIQMTAAVGDHPGDFLLCTSGAPVDHAGAIHSRSGTDTYIMTKGNMTGLAPGDTFNVVRPSIHFQCRSLTVMCRLNTWYSAIVRTNGRIGFMNMQLDIPNTNDARSSLLIDCASVPAVMSFVQLNPPDDGSYMIKSGLNTQSGLNGAETLSASGVSTICGSGTETNQHFAGLAIKDTGKNFPGTVTGGGCAQWLATRGLINLTKDCKLNHVSCQRLATYLASSEIMNTIAEGRANSGAGGGLESYNSLHDIDKFTVFNSDNVISLLSQSTITLSNTDQSATYSTITGYGIYFKSSAFIELHDAGANLTGATGAIRFDCVSPGVTAAIPAAYGWTQQQSAVVKRLSV